MNAALICANHLPRHSLKEGPLTHSSTHLLGPRTLQLSVWVALLTLRLCSTNKKNHLQINKSRKQLILKMKTYWPKYLMRVHQKPRFLRKNMKVFKRWLQLVKDHWNILKNRHCKQTNRFKGSNLTLKILRAIMKIWNRSRNGLEDFRRMLISNINMQTNTK